MSTSVNWRRTRAMSMPTALTQMAASAAHVGKALKEMGSTVQVNSILYTRSMYMLDNKFNFCCRYSRV